MHLRNCLRIFLGLFLVASSVAAVSAAVKLPAVIGDNMVLQQGQPLPIWGWADAGEEVTVTLSNSPQRYVAQADQDGRWKVILDSLKTGSHLDLTVKGASGNSITVKNVLVGEVWICSGQSNMEMGVQACQNAKEEIAKANHPEIRLFHIPHAKPREPVKDVQSAWAACTPKSVCMSGGGSWGGFSAAAYYFGRHLHKELGVPVGLIQATWGGTCAESWTSRSALEAQPALKSLLKDGDSTVLYNGMIAPVIPFGIRGAIWYQGESNADRAYQYRTLFPVMIADWRARWGQGDFPFGFVQIAPFRYGKSDPRNCPELQEAQLLTLKTVPNTGMAVTVDIGDAKDIHPKNKQDVGRRLALWALAKVYGRQLVYSGPIYKSMQLDGNKIRLRFDHVGSGLASLDGKPLNEFTIAGEDQQFLPAMATIEGDEVVVYSDQITNPVAVRFAWRDDTAPNLGNKEGLPTSPFRTDQWKGATEGK